jgi:anion-transporting  ArsA/GET3 family ATPase
MQQGYLEQIRQAFGDQVRALVPLFDAEVRGLAMLRQMGQALFGDSSQMPETGGEWPGNQPTSPGSPL